MKMRLMTFDEACKAFYKEYPTKVSSSEGYVFGLGENLLPWGENVEVDIESLDNKYSLPTYKLNDFFVPTCFFKTCDENFDKDPCVVDFLRYSIILTDDELLDETNACVRIKIISYEQAVYYIKRVNGEVVEFKKVGVVG